MPVSYVVPSIHPVFYTGTSACILCRAKYTPSVLYWNQYLYPMSCQVYTQCFILELVLVSYVVPSIHPVFYTGPVPVSYVMPSIHQVFNTGTSACVLCHAKYTPSVLYWNQYLYPMSCQVYTKCFILEPVPVSYVVPIIHSVFYTEPVPVSYVVPSIHPVFYTGTSACILCRAKYTPSVLYWNQYLYHMSCQVSTKSFILEPVPVSYVVPIIHSMFYTGTSACILCRAKYTPSVLYETSTCILFCAKYTPSVLYWNQCLYPMSCQVYTQCFILEPELVSYVVPSIHPVFYTGPVPVSHVMPSIKYTPSV